jgi:hypothetical protein
MAIHTFVVCAYKDSPYLEDCVQSLMNQQSVRKGESVVTLFTATPSDFVKILCEHFAIPLFTGVSKGIGTNWNEALKTVRTPYATIAHQDDIYLPDYGETLLTDLQRDATINLIFSDYQEIDKIGVVRENNANLRVKHLLLKFFSLVGVRALQRKILSLGNFICCPAVTYNLERIGNLRFDTNLRFVVDWEMWLNVLKQAGKITYIKQPLMYHRIHELSETSKTTDNSVREKEEVMIFEKYWGRTLSKLYMKGYVRNQNTNYE